MCATYSVQCGWQVSVACCREGDNFSIIPKNHRVFKEKGLRAPFKSKWVGHVLQNAIEETPGLPYQIMHKLLKPNFNEYVLTNNVLQEARDEAKGDLFGDPDDNVRYAYAIAKALQQMGQTVKVIFTDQCETMQRVNAIVLKEEMDRQKAAKSSMSRQEKVNYANNCKKDNDTFLCDAFGFEDSPHFKVLTGIFISPSTSKEQCPFLQEVLQADAAHMSFGKYTLHSVYGTNANGTMSASGFALLFRNEDKQSWTRFWNFIKKTHPTINQSKYTIITNQDKGSLSAMEEIIPLAGRFLCSFHCRQKIMKKFSGGTGQRPLFAMWMYNLLMGCSQLHHFQPQENGTRKRCTPQTATTSLKLQKKCNSQPQGVLRAILFACMAKVRLLVV